MSMDQFFIKLCNTPESWSSMLLKKKKKKEQQISEWEKETASW